MGARVTTSAQKQGEVIERVKNTSAAFRVFELDDLITNLPLKSNHPAKAVMGGDQAAAAGVWQCFQCQGSSSCSWDTG